MAQALVELFSRFGVPKEIHSDQGSSFKAEVVTKVEELMEAKPVFATPYHSQTSGVAERRVQVLKNSIKAFVSEDPH